MTWPKALDQIKQDGPASLIKTVRQAEATDPNATTWPRNKPSDDATTIHVGIQLVEA